MITQRFRPVGWVAGVAAAACALYMISLQVASERGRLEEVDRKIASAKRDIRQLQTELGTRASLRQLERWNGEVLALSAPGEGQYLPSEDALARLDRSKLSGAGAPPPPVMMAVMTPEAKPEPAADTGVIEKLIASAPPPKPLTKTDRVVQAAIAPQRAERRADAAKPASKVAMVDRNLLDGGTMGELTKKAAGEAKGRSRP